MSRRLMPIAASLLGGCAPVGPLDVDEPLVDDVDGVRAALPDDLLVLYRALFAVDERGRPARLEIGGDPYAPLFLVDVYRGASPVCSVLIGVEPEHFDAPDEWDAPGSLARWLALEGLALGFDLRPDDVTSSQLLPPQGADACALPDGALSQDPLATLLGPGVRMGFGDVAPDDVARAFGALQPGTPDDKLAGGAFVLLDGGGRSKVTDAVATTVRPLDVPLGAPSEALLDAEAAFEGDRPPAGFYTAYVLPNDDLPAAAP